MSELCTAVTCPDVAVLTASRIARADRLCATTCTVPPPCALCKEFALCVGCADTAGRHLLARHETQQASENGADFPGGIEALRVKVGYTQAQPAAGLKAARGCVHANGRRGEGIVWWEVEGAPVLAALVRRVWWAGDDVVPL